RLSSIGAPRGNLEPMPKPPRPPSAQYAQRGDESDDDTQNPRLSKRMSELGLCSRREADEWIANGWVKVDGVVASVLGTRVAPGPRIEIAPAARRQQSESVTILLHKPVGYVSGQPEDDHPPAIALIRPENRWEEDRPPRKWRPALLRGPAPA